MVGDETVQLRDVCVKIGSGATPRGGKEAYKGGSTTLIRSQNIYNEGFHRDGLVYIDDHQSAELRNVEVQPNDVLLNITGDSVARCCQVAPDVLPARVNQHVAIIRPEPKSLDANFLRYVLVSQAYQSRLLALASAGATRPALTKSMIEDLEVPSPPLAEQKAIAAVLGALDDKIELNRRMNATLESMARALFQSWFVDFDPVRAKLDGREPGGMDAATAALFPERLEESPLGHIPKGWKVTGLPDAIDFLEGPGLRNWQYRDEGMKFLNIRCIGDGDLDIAKANCISLQEFEKTYSHFALQEDDIVISTSGTLGRLAIVRADHLPIMLNTSIIRMRGRDAVGLGYVWGFLQSEYFLAEMFALAAGSVQLNFGPMHLRQIAMLRPPDRILEAFEHTIRPLLMKSLQHRKESRTLATLRDTLLPKLLSGELSVAGATEQQNQVLPLEQG